MIKAVENISATPDQKARRAQSEDYCRQNNVPVYSNPNSLFAPPESEVTLRSKDQVVDRALALCYLGLKSEGLEQDLLEKIDQDYRISSKLSPAEKLYATSEHPTQQQIINANWRYESLHVMLWALGFVDTLMYPDTMCDVASDVTIIHDHTEARFRQEANLRSKKDILDQADLILRLDWACVSARINNQPAPGNLDPSVVYERHYSLNWLISYLNQDWDDVSTDT